MQSKRNAVNQQPGFNQAPPSSETASTEEPAVLIYEIQVKGCNDLTFLDDWFGDMEYKIDPEQDVIIFRGLLADQAELYGLLNRLRSKGLNLISVQEIQQGISGGNDVQNR